MAAVFFTEINNEGYRGFCRKKKEIARALLWFFFFGVLIIFNFRFLKISRRFAFFDLPFCARSFEPRGEFRKMRRRR